MLLFLGWHCRHSRHLGRNSDVLWPIWSISWLFGNISPGRPIVPKTCSGNVISVLKHQGTECAKFRIPQISLLFLGECGIMRSVALETRQQTEVLITHLQYPEDMCYDSGAFFQNRTVSVLAGPLPLRELLLCVLWLLMLFAHSILLSLTPPECPRPNSLLHPQWCTNAVPRPTGVGCRELEQLFSSGCNPNSLICSGLSPVQIVPRPHHDLFPLTHRAVRKSCLEQGLPYKGDSLTDFVSEFKNCPQTK